MVISWPRCGMAFLRVLVLALAGLSASISIADDPVADPASAPLADAAKPAADKRFPKPDQKKRRLKATAGLMAVAGIAIVGIAFAAVIIIWARRLRRLAREPIPTTGRQDPFWFLRPEKTLSPRDTDEIDTANTEER